MSKRIIYIASIAEKIGKKKRSAWNFVKIDGFPAARIVPGNRAPGWLEDEVDAFLDALPKAPEPSEPARLKGTAKGRKGRRKAADSGTGRGNSVPLSAQRCSTLPKAERLSAELENAAFSTPAEAAA